MPHEVETMFAVGATPWHGLGTILPADTVLTGREAIVAAGLDWTCSKVQLQLPSGAPVDAYAVVRDTDGAILAHSVGARHTLLQNAAAFSFFDPFTMRGDATYETAGSLRGGSRVWALAQLTGDPLTIRKGDDVRKYLLLSHAHDGTLAVRVGLTPVRVVCANTLAMAHADRGSSLISVKHTKGMAVSLDAAADQIRAANHAFHETGKAYQFLASKSVRSADIAPYVAEVFAVADTQGARARRGAKAVADAIAAMPAGVLGLAPAGGYAADNDTAAQGARLLPEVTRLFETGAGNGLGTWWDLYNGLTEYLVHARRGTAESRLDSMAYADGAAKSSLGLEAALRRAKAA